MRTRSEATLVSVAAILLLSVMSAAFCGEPADAPQAGQGETLLDRAVDEVWPMDEDRQTTMNGYAGVMWLRRFEGGDYLALKWGMNVFIPSRMGHSNALRGYIGPYLPLPPWGDEIGPPTWLIDSLLAPLDTRRRDYLEYQHWYYFQIEHNKAFSEALGVVEKACKGRTFEELRRLDATLPVLEEPAVKAALDTMAKLVVDESITGRFEMTYGRSFLVEALLKKKDLPDIVRWAAMDRALTLAMKRAARATALQDSTWETYQLLWELWNLGGPWARDLAVRHAGKLSEEDTNMARLRFSWIALEALGSDDPALAKLGKDALANAKSSITPADLAFTFRYWYRNPSRWYFACDSGERVDAILSSAIKHWPEAKAELEKVRDEQKKLRDKREKARLEQEKDE